MEKSEMEDEVMPRANSTGGRLAWLTQLGRLVQPLQPGAFVSYTVKLPPVRHPHTQLATGNAEESALGMCSSPLHPRAFSRQ
jgi:hypothetical protein